MKSSWRMLLASAKTCDPNRHLQQIWFLESGQAFWSWRRRAGTVEDNCSTIKKARLHWMQTGFVVVKKSGNTYFRTGGHYHRLRKLNYCVRDGNRCAFRKWSPGESCRGGSPLQPLWSVTNFGLVNRYFMQHNSI